MEKGVGIRERKWEDIQRWVTDEVKKKKKIGKGNGKKREENN